MMSFCGIWWIPVGYNKSRNVCGHAKQWIKVMSMPQSHGEQQPRVVAATTVVKEGGGDVSAGKDVRALENSYALKCDCEVGGGNGSNGKFLYGRGGGGGGGSDNKHEGPIMKFDEVMRETVARGASHSLDMLEAAKRVGICRVLIGLTGVSMAIGLCHEVVFYALQPNVG